MSSVRSGDRRMKQQIATYVRSQLTLQRITGNLLAAILGGLAGGLVWARLQQSVLGVSAVIAAVAVGLSANLICFIAEDAIRLWWASRKAVKP